MLLTKLSITDEADNKNAIKALEQGIY